MRHPTGSIDRSPGTAPRTIALPRELILASAGSGKTFRVSSRLIGLLASGVQADAVFASTFTRKAAGEILDRVLSRLADASLDAKAAAELAQHSGVERGDCLFWSGVLERTVRQLHRLNIGTLDAFFVRTTRSFAFELGLPPDWSIADDAADARLRELALGDVFAKVQPDVLVEVVRAMVGGRATRSVHDSLLRQTRDLLDVHYALDPAADDAWEGFGGDDGDTAGASSEERAALADGIAAAEAPLTTKGAPHGTWVGALQKAADAVRAGDWKTLLDGKLCQAALEGRAFSRKPVPPAIADLLHAACAMARVDLMARYHAQARALGVFTRLYAEALEQRRRSTGLYGFSDLTRLLGTGEPLAARPDLHYRLDAQTRHMLIDEFQDTSLPQWEALQPLAAELLAGHEDERAAVFVADQKQSIYGWRGGSPELVDAVRQRHALATDVLARSWRSSPIVLDTVNELFTGLATLPIWETDRVARDVVAGWSSAFTRHVAAKPELPGHVRVEVGPADEGRSQKRPNLCRHAAKLVAELHATMPGFSIGVLTRTNAAVARIMYELRRLGVHASEEGGNALTDAAPVMSLLALLRMADHPGNTVTRYHVAGTPVGAAVGYTDHEDAAGALAVSHRIRRRLMDGGYGRTLSEIAARIRPACDPRERRRLDQLVELAFRYDADATLRPSDFVAFVETQRVEDPTSADVRVMTVHQSKGLEFDVVVLPELDAKLTRTGRRPLTFRPDPVSRATRAFPRVNDGDMRLLEHVPGLTAAADQNRGAGLRDALSTLYVAVTRARHALHVVVKPDGKEISEAKSSARVLREALAPDVLAVEGVVLYERGSADWFHTVERTAGGATAGAPVPVTAALRRSDSRTRVLARRSPSDLEGGSRVDLGMVLRLGGSAARDRGSIAHLWFEHIGWIEDGVPSREDLVALARRVSPDIAESEFAELLDRFAAWLRTPDIRATLSNPGGAGPAGGELSVEAEVPFIQREGDVLIEGIIDRLVLRRADGRVTGADIIDFKTDAIAPGDDAALAARADHYRPQLGAYRRAVQRLYRLPEDAVTARLVFLEAAAVVPL